MNKWERRMRLRAHFYDNTKKETVEVDVGEEESTWEKKQTNKLWTPQ